MTRSVASRLSFVLVNWNTRDLLLESVRNLLALGREFDCDLTVVDNDSSDGSAEALRDRYPQVFVIRNEQNVGFARAVNQAVPRGAGGIVCLLNPDIEVEAEPLRRCLEAMEQDRSIGALGPLLLDRSGKVWHYADRFPTAARAALRALLQVRSQGRLSAGRAIGPDLREVDWLAGACLLLRRDALERIGLLDDRFFLYCEDVDLCRRLRDAGFRIVRHQGVRLKHGIAQSVRMNPGDAADRARVEGIRSSILYASKHEGTAAARILAASLGLSLLPRIAKAHLLASLGHRESRRKARWMREALTAIGRPTPAPVARRGTKP
jgi:GT2 family glycosyltransferase